MITVKILNPNIYRVTEIVYSFHGNVVQHWYYDMNRLILSEMEDFPDSIFTRKLNQTQIDWFNTHYKAKAK